MRNCKHALTQFCFGLVSVVFLASFIGCGSTSGVKSTAKTSRHSKSTHAKKVDIDFSKYNRVVVNDFEDATTSKKEGYKKEKHEALMKKAVVEFPDMIVAELKAKAGFKEVVRNIDVTEDTLVIGGQITKCREGDQALKLLVGFGAGSTNFDANVEFRDGSTNSLLGVVKVDKNSWALGGVLAMTQTVESFMEGAAKNIAKEVSKTKPIVAGVAATNHDATNEVEAETVKRPVSE